MLKAHLQAWVWQDEWFGLTMEVGATYIFFPSQNSQNLQIIKIFKKAKMTPRARALTLAL
jgi:hypothetical protein